MGDTCARSAPESHQLLRALPIAVVAAVACVRTPPTRTVAPRSPAQATVPQPPLDRAALAASVRSEFVSAWRAYQRFAWSHDELKPVTHGSRDWYGVPLLVTPVDALDTMLVMGLSDDAAAAEALIFERLSFDQDVFVKNFEVTIRLLGGLLSSYQWTGDGRLLALANDLGTRLLPAFDSPTGMPYVNVNLKTGRTEGRNSNPAEIGTLVLEFGALAKLTGNAAFYQKAKRALVALHDRRSPIGLVGEAIDVESGRWTSRSNHVSGGIDSYYEYLLKCSRLFGDPDCEKMWTESKAALDRYVADDTATGLWYGQVDMATGAREATTYGALDAFLPAVLALGGDVVRARRLEDSCFRMWNLHGIEPDTLDYATMRVVDPGYPLRPEIVESAYYLYQYTKDTRYLEMGRSFFDGLLAYCRTDDGYTVLRSVVTKEKGDLMPSFFLAETLKYLYLLFAPDETIDLDNVVFTTEAHPIRRTW